jgi:hypothetical protein
MKRAAAKKRSTVRARVKVRARVEVRARVQVLGGGGVRLLRRLGVVSVSVRVRVSQP